MGGGGGRTLSFSKGRRGGGGKPGGSRGWFRFFDPLRPAQGPSATQRKLNELGVGGRTRGLLRLRGGARGDGRHPRAPGVPRTPGLGDERRGFRRAGVSGRQTARRNRLVAAARRPTNESGEKAPPSSAVVCRSVTEWVHGRDGGWRAVRGGPCWSRANRGSRDGDFGRPLSREAWRRKDAGETPAFPLGGRIELGAWIDLSVEGGRSTQAGGAEHRVALSRRLGWEPSPLNRTLLRRGEKSFAPPPFQAAAPEPSPPGPVRGRLSPPPRGIEGGLPLGGATHASPLRHPGLSQYPGAGVVPPSSPLTWCALIGALRGKGGGQCRFLHGP